MKELIAAVLAAANLLIVQEAYSQTIGEDLISDLHIFQFANKPVLKKHAVSFTFSGACKGKVIIPVRDADIHSGAQLSYGLDAASSQLTHSAFMALGLWFRSKDEYLIDPIEPYAELLNIRALYNPHGSKGKLIERVKNGERVISLTQKNSLYVQPRMLTQQSAITCGSQSFNDFLVSNGYWDTVWDNSSNDWKFFGILNSVGDMVSSESLSLTFTGVAHDSREEAGKVTSASFQLKQRAVMTYASVYKCHSKGKLGSEASTLICQNTKPFKIKYSVDISGDMSVPTEIPQSEDADE